MPPSDMATMNTPLAPSVERAYYRKCIELKRRLNEVEEANDVARTRQLRLDRAVLKLRLERAFLLEQLAKRMEADDVLEPIEPEKPAHGTGLDGQNGEEMVIDRRKRKKPSSKGAKSSSKSKKSNAHKSEEVAEDEDDGDGDGDGEGDATVMEEAAAEDPHDPGNDEVTIYDLYADVDDDMDVELEDGSRAKEEGDASDTGGP